MRYRFGQFELDSVRYALTRAGTRLAVRPKVFDILRYLVERPEVLVTKQELLDALWTGQQVNETSVPWTIGHARRAIGQQSTEQTPIETVHGRGYRWRGPIEIERVERAAVRVPAAPFVGRQPLMAALGERLLETKASRGGFILLVGDAGIGKTRCIDELAVTAAEQGFAIWSGRSAQDTLAPVYFPWVQALRSANADAQVSALLARLNSIDERARSSERDAVLGRLSLFEAMSRCLVDSARNTPLLLVLDDLHWSDAGTIELLSFVSAELRNARVLVIAASRVPLATNGGTAESLRHAERFDLEPLSVDGVSEYVRALSGDAEPGRDLCEALHRASAGYPLFVQETLRGLLVQHGRRAIHSLTSSDVRPSVQARDLLRGRLSALGEGTQRALSCASVLGESFELTDLVRLAGTPIDALLDALDGALRSGFVQAEGAHGFRFRHALFREAAYEHSATADRLRFHRAVAQMRQDSADASQRKSEIAHHYYRSLALGDPARVRAAALEAAEAASRAASFADASQFCAWALEALALEPGANKREYAELLLRRAHAQRCAGSSTEARTTLEQLVQVASEHGDCDLLVQAARALRLSHAMGPVPDPLARAALERVLELVPDPANELRIQAMSLLAWLSPVALDMQQSKAMSEHALELARRSANRDVLAEALTARMYALSGPDDIDALLATSHEMLALDSQPRGWISVEAYTAQDCALMHRGDLAGAKAALEALGEIAKVRGFVELRWHYERHCAQRNMLSGDFASAKSEFKRLEAAALRMRTGDGVTMGGIHRAVLKVAMHGPRAFAPGENPNAIRAGMRPTRAFACYHANLARLALAFDKPEPARQVLDELAVDGFAGVPKNLGYLNTLCNLALVAIRLADRPNAAQLYALLAPYPRHNTPNNLSFYDGPVAHFLALLAAFLGRDDRAARHFAQAIEISDQLGLRPMLARSCFACARWSLQLQSDVRGTARGVALRARAIELSEELGMQWLAGEARALAAPKRAR